MTPRDLERVLSELDLARRRVDALLAETVGIAERRAAYASDGHNSICGWVKATCNRSRADTTAVVQYARLLHAIPEARAAAHAGRLGTSQANLLARVFANRRCADQLPGSAELLVDHANSLWFADFAVVARRWEALADAEGAHRAHHRAHRHRDAHVSIVGRTVHLDAHGGVAAGTILEEVFTRFCDTEFHADYDAGRAQWGDSMHAGLLERSPAQRRFDALVAIFTAAAASGIAGTIDPLVNLVADQTTLDYHLSRLAGTNPTPPDPATVDQRRCETASGHPIDPDDLLAALLIGHVRRVVYNTAGVVIDLGRRSRLFTGGARDAVILGDRWCLWPGCDVRSGRCQTDHTTPWATTNGPTRPDNAGPACGRHNRWKHQHGYTTRRDPRATGTPTDPTAPKSAASHPPRFRTTGIQATTSLNRERDSRSATVTARWRNSTTRASHP